jgi:predicted component of type VI protein secretion system
MKRNIWLVMRTAAGGERPFRLHDKQTVIGRGVRCDIRVPLPKVAARHCELTLEDGDLILRDLGTSPGGTLHNGRPAQEAVLRDTDRVTIGPVTFEVRFQKQDAPAEIDIAPSRASARVRPAASAYTAARGS